MISPTHPTSDFRKNSLGWNEESSKVVQDSLLEKETVGRDMENCLMMIIIIIIIKSCFCGRIISGVICFSLSFFFRHQFVENNLILKMGPVDKRKVRASLNFL